MTTGNRLAQKKLLQARLTEARNAVIALRFAAAVSGQRLVDPYIQQAVDALDRARQAVAMAGGGKV